MNKNLSNVRIILISALFVLGVNFLPGFTEEPSEATRKYTPAYWPLEQQVYMANEIIIGKTVDITKDVYGEKRYTLNVEKVLKSSERTSQDNIQAECHAPNQKCPDKEQSSIIIIFKSGHYSIINILPLDKEEEIVALVKEQDRIMQEGSEKEAELKKAIDMLCNVLENNNFEGFKDLTQTPKIDGRDMDDALALETFNELKSIHKQYDYRKIFSEDFKKQRYPISKGTYDLGGHEYDYTSATFESKNSQDWLITKVDHCK